MQFIFNFFLPFFLHKCNPREKRASYARKITRTSRYQENYTQLYTHLIRFISLFILFYQIFSLIITPEKEKKGKCAPEKKKRMKNRRAENNGITQKEKKYWIPRLDVSDENNNDFLEGLQQRYEKYNSSPVKCQQSRQTNNRGRQTDKVPTSIVFAHTQTQTTNKRVHEI